MGDTQPSSAGTKRKRSVIACSSCHDRKVRCNVALQGVPCSNCMQDGVRCEIYRRKIGIPGQRPLRQRQSPSNDERAYPLTPSPGSAGRGRSNSAFVEGGVIDHQIAQTSTPAPVSSSAPVRESTFQQPRQVQERQLSATTTTSTNDRSIKECKDVVPYFAGESEGLEFLFDQCSPDRPVKGVHYVTPKKTYRHKRSTSKVRRLEPPLPPLLIQQELVRCFFHFVYPLMPIIDAKAFLEAFDAGSPISPLLLWSIFFAALNFVDKDFLRTHRLAPRKLLKEQYYQHAKEIYDNQDEDDKVILMVAALLLGSWYVDLEDRDGSWYWIGTAIALCHTVGFHRATNYASMPNCPFTAQTRQQWRRIWWSCFYREAWLAQGFGRPMRVHVDDCDVSMPHPEEVLEELRDLPSHLQEQYIPPDLLTLMDAWLVLLHLSVYLEDILVMYYRPRSPLPVPTNLRQQETDLLVLRNKIPATSFATPPLVLTHICHLEMYFNAILILLYRPYLMIQVSKLSDQEHITCRTECISKAKAAASDTTNILNKLMSLNAISQSPSSLVSVLMTSGEVLAFDVKNSSGLGKSYATHQLDLHVLVLSHLKKTYWTADLQYNLFTEVIKAMNGEASANAHKDTRANTPAVDKTEREESTHMAGDNSAADLYEPDNSLAHAALDDFFGMFNPFMGLPSHGDELSTSVDWDLSPPSSLALQSMSGRLES